jgi:glycine C-acetyltransferase
MDATTKAFSLKDFINVPGKNFFEAAEYFQKFIDQMDEDGIRGYGIQSVNRIGSHMSVIDPYSDVPKDVVSFVGNDYLGYSQHPATKQAAIDAIIKYGTGANAAPMIGGLLDLHRELEKKIARFVSCDDALIYTSGFIANWGTLFTLLNKADVVLMDVHVHASIIDGRYATNFRSLLHNDPDYLEQVLKEVKDKYTTKLVITEGVFSQDGDLANLPEYVRICKKYGAFLYVDDAHGIGVMGKNGHGTIEHYGLEGQVDIVVGTFSKSTGSVGGFVAGSNKLIQYLKHCARASVFSSAQVPSVTASTIKALELIDQEPQTRAKLWENVQYLRNNLIELGFDIGHSQSAITPLMIRDDYKVKKAARMLLESGVFTIPIIYPGVKSKESRIRILMMATHTKEDIDKLIAGIIKVDKELNIKSNLN